MYGPNANNWMQDNHDVWNNSMDLAGIQNGGIVGFKYFGFGGLGKDTKGCKAFEGIKKGDNCRLNLNLTPSGKGAFTIHVKLDDPWKGEEVAAFVPEITITVDGQKLNIPEKPVMSTNANGYTECNHYQLYAPLKAGSKLQATCEKGPVLIS